MNSSLVTFVFFLLLTNVARAEGPLLERVPPEASGIDFVNEMTLSPTVNYYDYINVFNGGGVAIADLDGDGRSDLYFTGNLVSNRLYRNRGELRFEDVTARSGADGGGGWCTGVTVVDIEADGDLDLYVCRAFRDENPALRRNLLYVNDGTGRFTERAAAYGIDDPGHSTQATFLDFDGDGDLDLFVGNHPRERIDKEELIRFRKRQDPPLLESDRLYRNEGDGTFVDVTEAAGVLSYGFTLGVIATDLDHDGHVDLYVAVDHAEPDLFLRNNGDGTFTDRVHEAFRHISNFGMGVDAGDVDNDGLTDLVVVDMLARDNYRQKSQMSAMAPARFWSLVRAGYHYQYMRNTLQLNRGGGRFSEIGQMAGIAMTDWSWAALLADLDNDGRNDLFVTNGYRKDTRDNDSVLALREHIREFEGDGQTRTREEILRNRHEFVLGLSETRLPNHLFLNRGDYRFEDRSAASGLSTPSFSQGAAYGDLDGDGDLELVVNNMDDPAFLYRNRSVEDTGRRGLRVRLVGPEANPLGLGSRVAIDTQAGSQHREMTLTRGFQSSVDPVLHFGVDRLETVDRVEVTWPDGRITRAEKVDPGELLVLAHADAKPARARRGSEDPPPFVELPDAVRHRHVENEHDDFATEVLLPHLMSRFGPALAVGDVDGDGREDLFVGGAAGQAGSLYLVNETGSSFTPSPNRPWEEHRDSEDLGAAFLDVDGDGDLDLYVASGGNEFPADSPLYRDRLYRNVGGGRFEDASDALPDLRTSGSCVVPGDVDGDGDLDLFLGGRVQPGRYPFPPRSHLLRNEGGRFLDVTQEVAPGLLRPGLVTSAVFSDRDEDGDLDLLLVGEWTPILVFDNDAGKLRDVTADLGLAGTTGWWNRIVAADLDGDGDPDYAAGNLGLNYKYQASEDAPFHVYAHDFDGNGTQDIVLGSWIDGECFPVRGRQCSSEQMPGLKKQFPTYREFASATLEEIYGLELRSALHLQARQFASCVLWNEGEKGLRVAPLPVEAQLAPLYGIAARDFDGDGVLDLLGAGNFHVAEVETGRADAGLGILLTGDGGGGFTPVTPGQSGFLAPGDVRNLLPLDAGATRLVIVATNDGPLQVFRAGR